jgi:signal transduction histidine kinase
MLTRFLKRNRILFVFMAFYLVVLALAMLELDKQYYQNAKKERIVSNVREYIDGAVGVERLVELTETALVIGREDAPAHRAQFERLARQVIDAPGNPVYRVSLRSGSSEGEERSLVEVVNHAKYARANTFANSLFLRDFSNPIKRDLSDPQTGKSLGLGLYMDYTSPVGDQRIGELTIRYRWQAAFLALALTLLAAAVARSLLIPFNKVLNALEGSTPDRALFCRRPRSRLERLYNRMALDATLSRQQSRLREELARGPRLTGWEVVEWTCRSFCDQAGLALLACLETRADGPGTPRPTGRRVLAGAWSLEPGQVERLENALIAVQPRLGREPVALDLEALPGEPQVAALQMGDPDRPDAWLVLAIVLDRHDAEGAGRALDPLADALARGLARLIQAGLHGLSMSNQLLVAERGRANINLSRNLGHDLTNVIAATKLDLMAMERLLRPGQSPLDEPRREILGQSLEGLLRSTRFMQDTVDLYRAYAFLRRPVLEIHDGSALVAETLDLFAMSTSSKIDLRRDLPADAPRCVVDARLFKLAVFNLLANALRAIRRREPVTGAEAGTEEPARQGWIRVETLATSDGGLGVVIEDSGTGIVDAAGAPLPPHEIDKIFELGYSSRGSDEDAGEGLGLHWVRAIIEDLHGGAIRAENAPGAGARFEMRFPTLDRAPDIENAERRAKEYLQHMQRQRQSMPTD